jgi:hypothetical protein
MKTQLMIRQSPRYYRAVARSVGVPEFWIEDATQDIALAAWKDGKLNDPLAIRREAIDAARRYGPVSRHGTRRPTLVPLDAIDNVAMPSTEAVELAETMRSAFDVLTIKQRRALRRRLEELPMSSLDSAHASAARRKLRKELAGD